MDRTFIAPQNSRYYTPGAPVCAVYVLGYKIDYSHNDMMIAANCSVSYGSNSVDVTVFGNDDLQCDTYVLNVVAYVVPEGRYFGYF